MRKMFYSPLRRACIASSFIAMLALTGCSITPPTQAAGYVGEYVLLPTDGSQVDYSDLLILNPDHTTVGIRYARATGQVLKDTGQWTLDTTHGEHINIGDYSYPVEMSDSTIRLAINDNMNVYYRKVQ